jgi:acyl-coenzyme A thioesterase PaaI-like protein
MPSPGARVRSLWQRLRPLPGGRHLFSWLLRWIVPYSGTVRPLVLDLEPGFARARIADRRGVRNHLNSVHAIALANVAELVSGLAMTAGLPDGARGIVTALSIRYLKKARGPLVAEARFTVPNVSVEAEHAFESVVTDAAGDAVARATVTWRLGPAPRA